MTLMQTLKDKEQKKGKPTTSSDLNLSTSSAESSDKSSTAIAIIRASVMAKYARVEPSKKSLSPGSKSKKVEKPEVGKGLWSGRIVKVAVCIRCLHLVV